MGPANRDFLACIARALHYAARVSWQRVALIVVGVISLASRATTLAIVERNRRQRGERWTTEDLLLAVVLVTPFLTFGAACVVVGVWPRTRDLLYVAGVILVIGYLAQRLLARRLAHGADSAS